MLTYVIGGTMIVVWTLGRGKATEIAKKSEFGAAVITGLGIGSMILIALV